jgi:hypothetical protein
MDGGENMATTFTTPVATTVRPTKRQLARQIWDVIADIPRFATAPLYRRWHQRWGATPEEIAAPMPGDELIDGAQYRATRAITIAAPPEAVWSCSCRSDACAPAGTATTCSTT